VGCLLGVEFFSCNFVWASFWVVWLFFLGFWGFFCWFCWLLRVSFGCFWRILPVYLGAPLRFFNKSFITYKKKKKKKRKKEEEVVGGDHTP